MNMTINVIDDMQMYLLHNVESSPLPYLLMFTFTDNRANEAQSVFCAER